MTNLSASHWWEEGDVVAVDNFCIAVGELMVDCDLNVRKCVREAIFFSDLLVELSGAGIGQLETFGIFSGEVGELCEVKDMNRHGLSTGDLCKFFSCIDIVETVWLVLFYQSRFLDN